MALPPINTIEDSFIREVDEELRRDQLVTFWVRYGRWLIAAIVLGLVVLGGGLIWKDQKAKQAAADSEVLDAAVQQATSGNDAAAIKSLETLKVSSSEGYRATALLTEAAIKLQKQDLEGAAKIYANVAADESLPKAWRDLAAVRQTAVQYDRLAPDEVIKRLSPLAVKGNPWFGSAGELVGIAYIKKQRLAEAAKLFDAIAADPSVPQSIRGRAGNMAASLSAASAVSATQGKSK